MTDGPEWGDAYSSTIERVKAQDEGKSRLGMAALMWLSNAERPLSADELCHALAVELGSKDFNAGSAPLISTLVGYCQGLITVDEETSTVRLIHPSVKEYLSTHTDIFCKPHSAMAEICLTYLNSAQVKALSADPSTVAHDKPFLEYCSVYWGIHAKRELSDHARSLALELLRGYDDHISGKLLLKQVKYLDRRDCASNSGSDLGSDIDFPFNGLDCASFFGIIELVTTLKSMACYRDGSSVLVPTPVVWADRNRHEKVVEMLLTDFMSGHNYRLIPLIYAIQRGHERVVEILLRQRSVDPNKPDNWRRTALSYAAQDGLEGAVKILLQQQGVNPNEYDDSANTPLSFAARNGHVRVVEILLEHSGIDSGKPNNSGQTPLWYAASGGHEEVVKILLGQKDVNPDKPNYDGRTPLICAASGGHQEVVKILLERENVNPDKPGNDGRTALICAASGGHQEVVKILLGREEVDPNKRDHRGQTPLTLATRLGFQEVITLLQSHGA